MIARKQLEIPEHVSGRRVTNRGVHLQPFGFHGDWLRDAPYWIDLLKSMGMSWVVILAEGDSVRQEYHTGQSPLKVLLDGGIIPIIRELGSFPRRFNSQDTFLWTVDLYGEYGLKPFWIIRNEPFDDREWKDGRVPDNAWDIIMRVWAEAAQFIAVNGGYVGFPDGPCYGFNPFESIVTHGCRWIFDEGLGFYAGHHYGKNRPRDYPYDAVTRYGAKLTSRAYAQLLDDFAWDPQWQEEPLAQINEHRKELRSPDLTALEDDTCWRGWEKVAKSSLETLGYVAPMAMTEGGWVPRDRPGSGPNTDIRMPHTTPNMVAKKTIQMFDTPSPFFAICPWLLADEDMGGSGWPLDAWHGWAYNEKYGRKKPVIVALQETPPRELEPRSEPLVIDVNGDTRDWTWVEKVYGAAVRRGAGPLRLIEVHEYEGPATLDVRVVDSAGLPVEGVPFYYFSPEAPAIEPNDGEWRGRGVLRLTDAQGQISFPVAWRPCVAATCQGVVWPRGKGDALENLGMLAGTRNRHLNGVWQLLEDEDSGHDDESPPALVWEMRTKRQPGPKIIVGSLPRPRIKIVITEPGGNAITTVSGSKTEHGPGGFEILASHRGEYGISFLNQAFALEAGDGTTLITFVEVAPPPSKPESSAERWAIVFEKLARIEELVIRLLERDA